MTQLKNFGPRPLKVFVKYGSRAEAFSRNYAARNVVPARAEMPLGRQTRISTSIGASRPYQDNC